MVSRARLAFKALKVPSKSPVLNAETLDALENNFHLRSTVSPVMPWRPPDFSQTAMCGHRHHPGKRQDVPPPKKVGKCTCGIHAWNTIDSAIWAPSQSFGSRLCVAVALWGRVRAGQYALRVQNCQLMAVIMPGEDVELAWTNRVFNQHERLRFMDIIEANGLPVLVYGEHWHDPEWIRSWAAKRNLVPQRDMVEADNLLGDLEAI